MDGNSAAIELARRLSRTYQPPSVSARQYELPAGNSRPHTPLQTIYYTAVPRGLPCLWVSQHLAACSGTDFCNVCRKGYGISLYDHHGEQTRRRLWARHRHTVPAACLHHGSHRRTCPRMNDPDHPNVLIDDGGSGVVFYTHHLGHRSGNHNPFRRPGLGDAVVVPSPVGRRRSCALEETWNSLDAPWVS